MSEAEIRTPSKQILTDEGLQNILNELKSSDKKTVFLKRWTGKTIGNLQGSIVQKFESLSHIELNRPINEFVPQYKLREFISRSPGHCENLIKRCW